MRFRMITSMSSDRWDLPFGTQLSVGEELKPESLMLDRATADRWLKHGVIEVIPGTPNESPPPPVRAQIETTTVAPPDYGRHRERGRRR